MQRPEVIQITRDLLGGAAKDGTTRPGQRLRGYGGVGADHDHQAGWIMSGGPSGATIGSDQRLELIARDRDGIQSVSDARHAFDASRRH